MLMSAARCAEPEGLPVRDGGGESGQGRAGDEGVHGAKCGWKVKKQARGSGGVCGHARVGLMMLWAVAVWLVLPAVAARGVTIRVPQDQPTITAALTIARGGDVIQLAPGVYTEAVYFTGYCVTLRGTRTDTEQTVMRTIPDAGGNATAVIRGGSNPYSSNERVNEVTVEGIDFIPTPSTINSQAVLSETGNLRLVDCRIVGHRNTRQYSAPLLVKTNGSLTLEKCEFLGNVVRYNAVVSHIVNSPISTSDLRIIGCRFEGNVAMDGSSGWVVAAGSPHVLISGSLIVRNGKPNAAMYVGQFGTRGARIVNSTIADNLCGANSLIRYNHTSSSEELSSITNSIIWNNQTTSFQGLIAAHGGTYPGVTYSVMQGGYAGLHNLAVDPRFVDPIAGDYRLRAESPCIDAGNNMAIEIGDAMDFGGSPRFADVLNVPDNGVPSPAFPRAVVDFGPYEFVAPETCAADANHSGSVTADDLFIFLDQWFAQMGAGCP